MIIFYNTFSNSNNYTDRPTSPEIILSVSFVHNENLSFTIISWTAATMMTVAQNYTLVFDSHTVETTRLYHIYYQKTTNSLIDCIVYVTAVNGAGESDPSNNVTIPSLPDIGPVTDSLTHQVWKSGCEIMINVSFGVS